MTERSGVGPQEDPLRPIPRVLFLTEINEVSVVGLPIDDIGTTQDRTIRVAPGINISELPGRLTAIYEAFGPGAHPTRDVAQRLGEHINRFNPAARRLTDILPPELVRLERDARSELQLHLGEMAIDTVVATEAQKEAFLVRKAAIEAALAQRAREKELALDAEKIDLTAHDHAIVNAKGKGYYLPLDEPGTILAARVIEAVVALHRETNYAQAGEVARKLWSAMPTTERRLFTDTDKFIYGAPGNILNKDVYAILEGLLGRMLITQRGGSRSDYFLRDSEASIAFYEEPLTGEKGGYQELFMVYPKTSELALKNVPPEDAAKANSLVGIVVGNTVNPVVDHVTAIQMLQTLVDPTIKRAMTVALRRAGSDMSVGKALHTLHGHVRRVLGYERYYIAWGDLQVGGSKARRGIRQIGGALPGSRTNAVLGERREDVRWWTFEQLQLNEVAEEPERTDP